MVGFDFDGVVTTGKIKPTIKDVIITGNTFKDYRHVMDYLKENNVECAVYFMPYLVDSNRPYFAALWKTEIINRLGLPQFYEDSEFQYEIIKSLCPKCDVIKFKGD